MRKGIQIKTIRNLNLDHLGGKCRILTIWGGLTSSFPSFPPRMVKIQHFPPEWSRFRFLMVFIQYCLLISPPNGQDLAQICSKFLAKFLRLMALPVIEELSYLGSNQVPKLHESFIIEIFGSGSYYGNGNK